MRVTGSVVVITGASSGIGQATALAFAKQGARLELCARRLDKLEVVAEQCREAGSPEVNVRAVDVGQRAQARAFIAAAIRDYERLDILVNNAGIGWSGRLHQMPEEKIDELLATNIKGVVNTTQAALMVVLVLLSVPVSFVSLLNEVAALRLIDGPAGLGLGASEVNGLASFFLGLSGDTNALNSIFFGLWLFPFGLLVIKSGFIPRILGYLLIIAGCSYIVGSLTFLLSPPFGPVVSGIVTVGYLGELPVVGWLVFRAARVQFGGTNALIRNRMTSDSNLEGGNPW